MSSVTLDPRGIRARMEEYLEWLEVRHYSEFTLVTRRSYLSYFVRWCESYGLYKPTEVSKPILERYQRHLFYRRKKSGKPLSAMSQSQRLMSVRSLFRWMAQQNIVLHNPASDLELPRPEKPLPRNVLTPSEAEAVLAQPDVRLTLGLRDRAIIETFYATGIRRLELIRLKVFDLNAEWGTLQVRHGKNKRDRVVPVGERALAWIEKYLEESRPELAISPDDGALFLSRYGRGFLTGSTLTLMVQRYMKQANFAKRGACHIFRHSMATSMLSNGADIRFIQQMLGHACLSTTEIYTRVSVEQLKTVHDMTHPTAKLRRRKVDEEPLAAENLAAEDELREVLEAESAEEILVE